MTSSQFVQKDKLEDVMSGLHWSDLLTAVSVPGVSTALLWVLAGEVFRAGHPDRKYQLKLTRQFIFLELRKIYL